MLFTLDNIVDFGKKVSYSDTIRQLLKFHEKKQPSC